MIPSHRKYLHYSCPLYSYAYRIIRTNLTPMCLHAPHQGLLLYYILLLLYHSKVLSFGSCLMPRSQEAATAVTALIVLCVRFMRTTIVNRQAVQPPTFNCPPLNPGPVLSNSSGLRITTPAHNNSSTRISMSERIIQTVSTTHPETQMRGPIIIS